MLMIILFCGSVPTGDTVCHRGLPIYMGVNSRH